MKVDQIIACQCVDCGIQYCMEVNFHELRMSDGKSFYCPNGHAQHFTKRASLEEEFANTKAELEKTKALLTETQIELRKLKCDLLAFKNEPEKKTVLEKLGLK